MYVQNVLKNQLNKKNKTIALNVEDQIGLFQLMIININNILIINTMEDDYYEDDW